MQTECPFCHVECDIDPAKVGEKWQCPNCGQELLIEEEIVIEEDAGEGVIVECPACNRRFEAGAKDVGETAVCPFCQNDFTIFPVEEDVDESVDAGKGFLTACPYCNNQFEVGENDIGENALCPICNHEFVITGKKRNPKRKIIIIAIAAILVLVAAGIAYSQIKYYYVPNEKRAMKNFTEIIEQGFVSRGGELNEKSRALMKQKIAESYKLIIENGWQQQFIELFCDDEFTEFSNDIRRKKADKDYKPTEQDAAKEKKFWAYFRYKYPNTNKIMRQINLIAGKTLWETNPPKINPEAATPEQKPAPEQNK